MKKSTIIIIVAVIFAVIVASVLAVLATRFLTYIMTLPNTRGLSVIQIESFAPHVNETRVYVENTGKESLFIRRFYDENNDTLIINPWCDPYSFVWNGTFEEPSHLRIGYELFSGKYIVLQMVAQQFYSKEIYVEFSDGYKCRLWRFS